MRYAFRRIRPRHNSTGWARGQLVAGSGGLLAVALAAAGCALGSAAPVGNQPYSGGMASYALPANITPNYIFPFQSLTFYSTANTDNLDYFLYRPLYWYGGSGLPYLSKPLSLAYPPTYNGQVVTIKLKHYVWSNGETVNAGDVLFWMHMMRAEATSPNLNWGGYVPGELPDNVRNVKAVGQYEVQMTIKGPYSPLWFTYNELSQITPMPKAWDVTGPGASGRSDCTHHVSDCVAVFNYLNTLSQNQKTWTDPIWSVVDGPWRLTSDTSQGVLTFQLNKSYSGPLPKYHISQFQERPFTSEEAEYNVLQAGGPNGLDVGYLPTVDAPVPSPGQTVGQNPVPGYSLQAQYPWGLSYMPFNFNPADPQVAIINQQYYRQAIQFLVNQAAVIQGPLHGYGFVSTGPIGDYPRTNWLSPLARKGDPYPYSPGEARSLLANHGWTINPGGVSTCTRPGSGPSQCGPGVHAGAKMSFTLDYATGIAWEEASVLQLKSNASQIGIDIKLNPMTFNDVLAVTAGNCGPLHKSPCPWELGDWGQGWTYVPDYLPTGDVLFQSGSSSNTGQWSNAIDDHLIARTLQTSNLKAMYKWEDFVTSQVPIVLQPEAPTALVESKNNLHIGVQSPTLALTPENWYFVK